MARVFIYDGREFPDPDPKISIEDVRRQLADYFPELTNADTREEKRGDDTVYTFSKRIGTKGTGASNVTSPLRQGLTDIVVRVLRGTPDKRLRVLELIGELRDQAGDLDLDAVGARQAEVNLALAEAKAYARHTAQAVDAIRRLAPRCATRADAAA